ncbi:MAG: M23 family metallopeptidase, partial [Spirochaeta sp.]
QYGAPVQTPGAMRGSMQDVILSDNPEDLPMIAEQIEQARSSLLNVERLFSLNEELLQYIPNSWPLPNHRGIVTMEYGPNIHPFTRQVYLHKGFDVAEPRPGAPILAIADGVVEKADNTIDYGMHVWIRHRFGFRTLYAHLNSVRVSEGDRLSQGDMIGTLGSSGLSTGPHLHLELWMENQLLDPAPFLAISNEFSRRVRRNL